MEIKTTADIIRENKEIAELILDNKYDPIHSDSYKKKWVSVESLKDQINTLLKFYTKKDTIIGGKLIKILKELV